jgi:hypothetical protein
MVNLVRSNGVQLFQTLNLNRSNGAQSALFFEVSQNLEDNNGKMCQYME